jgi:hypothetical protein
MAMAEENAVVDMIRIATCSLICERRKRRQGLSRYSVSLRVLQCGQVENKTHVDRGVQPRPDAAALVAGKDRLPDLEKDEGNDNDEEARDGEGSRAEVEN